MLQNYKPNGGFDEMFDGTGSTRAHYRKFRSLLEEIFERGLHGYLDDLQIKFNRIGDALFEAYFFLSLAAQGEADFVQQEEQQQQSARPGRAALPSVNPV